MTVRLLTRFISLLVLVTGLLLHPSGAPVARAQSTAYQTVVITDDSGPIGLAGVMGGASSELSAATSTIVIEAAHFDALTIALMESGGSSEDLLRARLSCIDLEPKDPQSYLQAAKVMSEANQPERAIAFFKRHDQEQLESQYAVWQDEARLIETTRAAAEQLRELFETDTAGFESQDRRAGAERA